MFSMRFHNNNVTIALLSNFPVDVLPSEAVYVEQIKDGEPTLTQYLGKTSPSCTFDFANGDLRVRVLKPNSDYAPVVINTGIRNISFEYEHEGEIKGPSSDTLPMGQFCEIDTCPNITTHIVTFRGRTEADHLAMRQA